MPVATSESGIQRVRAMQIAKSDPTPIYLQIVEGFRSLVREGTLPPGTALPAERLLCDCYGISRMTLRQAYETLEREGLIECHRGRGTFVSLSRIEKQQQEMRSFTEEMRARKARPASRLVSFRVTRPEAEGREFFGLGEGETVYEIQRVRLRDDIPLALETVQVPSALCPGLDRFDLERQSLYQILEEEFGLELAGCLEEMSAVRPTRVQKQFLSLPPSVVILLVRRKTYTAGGQPAELTTTAYRGDLYTGIVRSTRMRRDGVQAPNSVDSRFRPRGDGRRE